MTTPEPKNTCFSNVSPYKHDPFAGCNTHTYTHTQHLRRTQYKQLFKQKTTF